jgi:hypothetical protein
MKTQYFTNRKDWRKWLENNFETEKEIWLIFPKISTGKPCLLYNVLLTIQQRTIEMALGA